MSVQPTSFMSLETKLHLLIVQTMNSIWNRDPRPHQLKAITHVFKMMLGRLPASPVLIVQPTGSGKSAIYQTITAASSSITIVIENTLALGSDQNSKIRIICIHINLIPSNQTKRKKRWY